MGVIVGPELPATWPASCGNLGEDTGGSVAIRVGIEVGAGGDERCAWDVFGGTDRAAAVHVEEKCVQGGEAAGIEMARELG